MTHPTPPRAGFLASLKATLWAFAGIRRRRDLDHDAASLDPRAVIAAGLIGGLLFVLLLVLVVFLVLP